jgi:hypothetical protein
MKTKNPDFPPEYVIPARTARLPTCVRVTGPTLTWSGIRRLNALPPRARLPVTIGTWQFGRGPAPRLKAAVPVKCSFHFVAAPAAFAKLTKPFHP